MKSHKLNSVATSTPNWVMMQRKGAEYNLHSLDRAYDDYKAKT